MNKFQKSPSPDEQSLLNLTAANFHQFGSTFFDESGNSVSVKLKKIPYSPNLLDIPTLNPDTFHESDLRSIRHKMVSRLGGAFLAVFLLLLATATVDSRVDFESNSRKCADPSCQEPISYGRTVLRYHAKDPGMLSFNIDQPVKIFSKKSQLDSEEFYEVEINGKRGFANKRYIQEMQVLTRNPQHDVPFSPPSPSTPAPSPSPTTTESAPPEQLTQNPDESNQGESLSTHKTPPAEANSPQQLSKSELNPEIISSMAIDAAASILKTAKDTLLQNPSSIMGAHATQASLSPEDMEFSRIQSTFANMKGEFALESSLSQVLKASSSLNMPTIATLSLISTASAAEINVEQHYEVIDGTSIPIDGPPLPPPSIKDSPISTSTDLHEKIEPTLTHTDIESKRDTLSSDKEKSMEDNRMTERPETPQSTQAPVVQDSPETEQPQSKPEMSATPEPMIQSSESEVGSPPTPSMNGMNEPILNSASPGTVTPPNASRQPDKDASDDDIEAGLEGKEFDDYTDDDFEDFEEDEDNPPGEETVENRKKLIQDVKNKVPNNEGGKSALNDNVLDPNTNMGNDKKQPVKENAEKEDEKTDTDDAKPENSDEQGEVDQISSEETSGKAEEAEKVGVGNDNANSAKDAEKATVISDTHSREENIPNGSNNESTAEDESIEDLVEETLSKDEKISDQSISDSDRISDDEAVEQKGLEDSNKKAGYLGGGFGSSEPEDSPKPESTPDLMGSVNDINSNTVDPVGGSLAPESSVFDNTHVPSTGDFTTQTDHLYHTDIPPGIYDQGMQNGNLYDLNTTPSMKYENIYSTQTPYHNNYAPTTATPLSNSYFSDIPPFGSNDNYFDGKASPVPQDYQHSPDPNDIKFHDPNDVVGQFDFSQANKDLHSQHSPGSNDPIQKESTTPQPAEETTEDASVPDPIVTEAATQQVPEASTQEVTEASTLEITEASTLEITEASTEQIVEASTEQIMEASTDQVTEASTEQVTEVPIGQVTEVPIEQVTEVPIEQATEVSIEQVTEASTEQVTEAPYAQDFAGMQEDFLPEVEVATDDPNIIEVPVTDTVEEVRPPASDIDETIEHYVEASHDFLPEWIHHMFHDALDPTISPRLAFITQVTALLLLLSYVIRLLVDKVSREGPLKTKLGALEKELFQVQNESKIIKRDAEETLQKGGTKRLTSPIQNREPVSVEPPKELLEENERLKLENEKLSQCITNEKDAYSKQVEEIGAKNTELQKSLAQKQEELNECEAIVQECLEEKKRNHQKKGLDIDLSQAIESLRAQLVAQQDAVGRYEAKIKKRESELKIKNQELRKQRADTANAKLEVTKVSNERESLLKQVEEYKQTVEGKETLEKELKDLKQKHYRLVEDAEIKDSELETKINEVDVLKETVDQLKNFASSAAVGGISKDDQGRDDGWDCEDALVTADLGTIMDQAQLKVELRKAQEACEKLSEQLTESETARDEFKKQMEEFKEDMEISRKAKDQSVAEKEELNKKLNVLTAYFNQREAELQKQLGMTANRLTDTTSSSESAIKQIVSLEEQVNSYKDQLKLIKRDMEEQERSLKAHNAVLEKRQHESWVTVRQETRKSAEAQNEMQTLRSRLLTTESKLVEKEFEISNLVTENDTLKETVEKISRASHPKSEPVFTNGNGSASSSVHSMPTTPPDLPPLPPLSSMMTLSPPMAGPPGGAFLPPDVFLPTDVRPAPLGGFTAPPPANRGYPSPSPPPSDPEYYGNRDGRFYAGDQNRGRLDSDHSSRYFRD